MRNARVVLIEGLYYPQVRRFFIWCNDYQTGFATCYSSKEHAIERAKQLAGKQHKQVVWDNDDYGA